ncbi:MAG: aspartate 1-decarboxylase [Bacteroidota bacterium]
MFIEMFQSKIHRARVTEANLNYRGSITIDQDLLDATGMLTNQRVQIVNVNNGERLETYIIPGQRGSGVICLNGPAARRVEIGDLVVIIAYAQMTPEEAQTHQPVVIHVDEENRIINLQEH